MGVQHATGFPGPGRFPARTHQGFLSEGPLQARTRERTGVPGEAPAIPG